MKYVGKDSLKITVLYILIGLVWVFFIDFLLFKNSRAESYTGIELFKDISFVLFSVGILFFLHNKNALNKQDYLKKVSIETEKREYLVNMSDNGFILLSNSGLILKCNTPIEKMLGVSSKQLINKNFSDLLLEYQLDGIESKKYINSKLRLVRQGSDQFFECYFNNFKKNSVFLGQVEFTNSNLYNSNIIAKIRDLSNIEKYQQQLIFKNKELEKRNNELRNLNLLLKESSSRFKVLFQNAPIAYQSLDINGRFIDINNTWLNILGYKKGEVIGKHFSDFMTPDSAKLVSSRFSRFKEVGEIHDIIFEMVKKDGKIIYTSFHGKIGYNKDGSFKQTYCIFNDISDQILKDKALKESYKKYKTVADFNYDWEYWLLPDGSLEYVSPSCERITGYTSDEFLQNPSLLNDIIVNEDKPIWRNHKMLTERDQVRESEIIFRIRQKDGNIKWIGHYCSIVYDEKGEYLGRRGSNRDITGRIIAERTILQERDLARNILESTNAGIWDWNIPEQKLEINERWAEIIGYKLDELKPINVGSIYINMHPDDEKRVRLLVDKVFKKEINYYDIDYRLKHKNGEWVWVNSRGKIIEWSKKEKPVRMIGTHLDITENKLSEKKAMNEILIAEEQERERIAKELHDGVSPVLSAVKLYCQSLLDTDEKKQKRDLVKKIGSSVDDTIESISEISNNISPHILRNFGLTSAIENFANKISELKLINISINSLLNERLNENIEVNLYRITTELINNTIKYAKAKNITIKYFLRNQEVNMIYSDDGKGFDIIKVQGKTKGMGLLNIRNRIELENGRFIFSSKQNKGIKIEISIPLSK